ncbi:MAG: PA2779 family protein [Moraxellaceae bacterium]
MNKTMKITALLLALSTGITSLPVQAVVITTEEATAPAEAASARAHLQALLAREDVQAGLARHGVSAAAAAARVAALSDAEAQQLSQQMDSLPAGGSVLGVIVFIFLVLLVTDILGLTKVFPFTRPIR